MEFKLYVSSWLDALTEGYVVIFFWDIDYIMNFPLTSSVVFFAGIVNRVRPLHDIWSLIE